MKVECPKCGHGTVTVKAEIQLIVEGSDDIHGTGLIESVDEGWIPEWDNDSYTICRGCDHEGRAKDFIEEKE